MDVLYLVLVMIHTIAASVWIGGTLLQEVALNPTFMILPGIRAQKVSAVVGSKRALVVWACLVILSATGIVMGIMKKGLGLFTFLLGNAGLLLLLSIVFTFVAIGNGLAITFVFTPMLATNPSFASKILKWSIRANTILGLVTIITMAIFSRTIVW